MRISATIFSLATVMLLISTCAVEKETTYQIVGGPRESSIDDIFSDLTLLTPGAAVAVVKEGEVIHRAGYGSAHLDHGVAIHPNTIFDIASISKQFAAFSALLLVDEGKLELDEDVRLYVPELSDFGTVITTRNLIHHTSGIRDWVQSMAVGGVEYGDVISFEMILRMLENQTGLNFSPGTDYAYSNTGYNLLTLVIERVSNQGFREFAEQRIFAPLEMHDTHFSDNHNEIIPDRAESYVLAGTRGSIARYPNDAIFERRVNQLTAMGSSSLHTTINDFIKWMRNYQTATIGGSSLVRQMFQRGLLSNGDTLDYAYGLSISEYKGSSTFGHSGSWVGFRSNFVHLNDLDLSIAVFCNFSTCDPQGRAFRIADLFIEHAPSKESAGLRSENPEESYMKNAQLEQYIGVFRNYELDTTFHLAISEGNLIVEHWRNRPVQLISQGGDIFSFGTGWFGSGQGRITFNRSASGEIRGFSFNDIRVRNLYFEKK